MKKTEEESREKAALRGLVGEIVAIIEDGTLSLDDVMINAAWKEAVKALGENISVLDKKHGLVKINPRWI